MRERGKKEILLPFFLFYSSGGKNWAWGLCFLSLLCRHHPVSVAFLLLPPFFLSWGVFSEFTQGRTNPKYFFFVVSPPRCPRRGDSNSPSCTHRLWHLPNLVRILVFVFICLHLYLHSRENKPQRFFFLYFCRQWGNSPNACRLCFPWKTEVQKFDFLA